MSDDSIFDRLVDVLADEFGIDSVDCDFDEIGNFIILNREIDIDDLPSRVQDVIFDYCLVEHGVSYVESDDNFSLTTLEILRVDDGLVGYDFRGVTCHVYGYGQFTIDYALIEDAYWDRVITDVLKLT